jgi:hypothetical protein
MRLIYTLTSEGRVVYEHDSMLSDADRDEVFESILREWQISSETRQAIIASNEIPANYTSYNGVQHVNYKLESQDLRELYQLFKLPQYRYVSFSEEKSAEDNSAELKAVYKILKKQVVG